VLVLVARRVGEDDGLELCRALREAPGHEDRIVVVVAAEGEVTVPDALQAGAADVWPVPPAPGHLTLRVKLAEHYARLQADHVRLGGEFALLRQALDRTGTGLVMTDPGLEDDPIVYANESFYELTGFTPDQVLGRNCRFLQGASTDPRHIAQLRSALAEDRPITIELVNERADGTPFDHELHVSPVHDATGRVVRRVGVQVDVTAHRERERTFAPASAARAPRPRRPSAAPRSSPRPARCSTRRWTSGHARRCHPPVRAIPGRRLRGRRGPRARGPPARGRGDRPAHRAPRPRPAGGPHVGIRGPRSARPRRAHGPLGGRRGLRPLRPRSRGGGHRRAAPAFERGAMIVPLKARGRIVGALAHVSLDPARRYTPEDLALAEELGRRAALALDNARLYERQSEVASASRPASCRAASRRSPGSSSPRASARG
jgi:PAS domain S-box-containing protein